MKTQQQTSYGSFPADYSASAVRNTERILEQSGYGRMKKNNPPVIRKFYDDPESLCVEEMVLLEDYAASVPGLQSVFGEPWV